jgi:hypothetical protein
MSSSHSVLLAAFTAVEGAHAYSAFLPSIHTIRHFRDASTPRDIRAGELFGTLFALGLGAVVSLLVGHWLPLYFALGTAILMVTVYEWALATP